MPERNLVQADLPVTARVIAPAGTAAGFAVDARVAAAVVYCLPGVPAEMRVMAERDVVPDVAARGRHPPPRPRGGGPPRAARRGGGRGPAAGGGGALRSPPWRGGA
jgi:hypothetical protein